MYHKLWYKDYRHHTPLFKGYTRTPYTLVSGIHRTQTLVSRIHTDTTPCIWDTQTSHILVSGIHRHHTPLFLGYTQTSHTLVQRTHTDTMTLYLGYTDFTYPCLGITYTHHTQYTYSKDPLGLITKVHLQNVYIY